MLFLYTDGGPDHNLGLQCVGLMRAKMSEDFEKLSSRCNSLADLRNVGIRNPVFKEAVADSVSDVKVLLIN